MISRSTSANNGANGIVADGSNTELQLNNSVVYGNGTGVSATAGATLESYKNNAVKLNGSNGTPIAAVGAD